jgi:ABC-2 type transport system permease protein
MNDPIDIGVYSRDGEPLYVRKHPLRSGTQRIVVTVAKEPARAAVDPHGRLIDRNWEDNARAVAAASGSAPTF